HELEWVRRSPRARQAKSKARLQAYETLLAEGGAEREGSAEIIIPPGPRLGDVVVQAEHLSKGYGDRLLFDDLSFTLPRGGIVGVIGANGAGKTTLLELVTGKVRPDAGELRVGPTVQLAYADQARSGLDGSMTVFEAVSGGLDHIRVGGGELPARAYVASFGFRGSDQQRPVRVLSGGERNR